MTEDYDETDDEEMRESPTHSDPWAQRIESLSWGCVLAVLFLVIFGGDTVVRIIQAIKGH